MGDVHEQMPVGSTAVYVAALRGYHVIVSTLIELGADIDKPTSTGETPLYVAAFLGHSSVVKKAYASRRECRDGSEWEHGVRSCNTQRAYSSSRDDSIGRQ